jgi:hypothetical protein
LTERITPDIVPVQWQAPPLPLRTRFESTPH